MSDAAAYATTVAIGGLPIRVGSANREFIRMLEERYAGFIQKEESAGMDARATNGKRLHPHPDPLPQQSGRGNQQESGRGNPEESNARTTEKIRLEVEVVPVSPISDDENDDYDAADQDLQVLSHDGRWYLERGDFRAEWDPAANRGTVRQSANPYSIDAVMRIVHSIVLAPRGGFLLHSASAVRNGRAFLFSGVSGAGKTTISRLAPPDVRLLTDEISYVRRAGDGYEACGTPFTGELARVGENIVAPVAALYLLAQGLENRTSPLPRSDAARRLMRNILFFADDAKLVEQLFRSACDFVSRVPVYELTFRPDAEVWDLIG